MESDVCVIGAGVSGVVAVKQCLEYGLSVICYEQRSCIGGLWSGATPSVSQVGDDSEPYVAIYQSLMMNISHTLTSFSDFPLPQSVLPNLDSKERFLSGSQFLEYLSVYAQHFKLMDHIHLSTRVLEVRKIQPNKEDCSYRWGVRVQQKCNGKEIIRHSRHCFVIIASGFHSRAFIPEVRTVLYNLQFR